MWILTALATSLLGVALHFLYDWFPSPLAALFSPINESVWEHLKLLFWPMLLGATFLARRSRNRPRLWSAFFAALLTAPALLLTAYYSLKAVGVERLWVDIVLYFICMFAGYALAWLLYRRRRPERIGGWLLMVVILYGASLILFTFAAPPLGIFQSPS